MGAIRKETAILFERICKETGASYPKGFRNPVKELEDYCIMYVLRKNEMYECLFDKKDMKKIGNDRTWICKINGSKDKMYVNCAAKIRHIALHRYLMECPKNMVVDHINGNPFDNRRINLRVCTPGVNMLNKKQYNANMVGITGICKYKDNYRLNIVRQFNDLDIAIQAKSEIQPVIDKYSNIDAAKRIV